MMNETKQENELLTLQDEGRVEAAGKFLALAWQLTISSKVSMTEALFALLINEISVLSDSVDLLQEMTDNVEDVLKNIGHSL